MTFAEAKDQVAQREGYKNWTDFYFRNNEVKYAYLEEAAELAIASAREEGYKAGQIETHTEYLRLSFGIQ